MIKVIYNPNDHLLTMEGHAQSGPQGHDLVCASASILAFTLADNVEYLAELGHVTDPVLAFDHGSAVIGCKVGEDLRAIVTLIYSTVCKGFALLAENYPNHISFTVQDV